MLARLWRLLDRRERWRVMWLAPLLVVSALVEIVGVATVVPFLSLLADPGAAQQVPVLGRLVAATGVDDPAVLVRWVGATLAFVLVLANVLVLLTNLWSYRFAWSLNHGLSSRLLRHYLTQPYAFVLERNSAALANKVIVEVRQVVEHAVRTSLDLIARSVIILALVGFLVALDPRLALIAFSSLGLAYGAIYVVSRRFLRRIGREAVAAGAARMRAVNEGLGGFKDIKVAGREAFAFQRYLAPSRRFADTQATLQAVSALPRYALEAVAVGGMVLVAALMAGREGGLTGALPLLGAYAFAGLRLMPAMQQAFAAAARLRYATGSLDAVEEDLQRAVGEELEPPGPPLPFNDAIRLEGITYAYPNTVRPALEDVTLELPRGRSLALVGRTGSGKSTLVDLMLGLYESEHGRLTVDGVLVTPDNRRAYRRLFGYVPQTIFLLDDTVTRNVAFGVPDDEVDMEAVRRACTSAQIARFVETELPKGYETTLGERGVRLSGGQRQRIGIARALYHQPEVLVFDEATSALDVHTEQQVFEALADITRAHTVVIVAHRLEAVADVDHAILLEAGRVRDEGPPGVVLARFRADTAEGAGVRPAR